MKEWIYHIGIGDCWIDNERYSSAGKAMEAALKEREESGRDGEPILAGRVEDYIPYINANLVIDMDIANAYDEANEAAEGYLEGVPTGALNELTGELTDTYHAWIKKHNLEPTFSVLKDIIKMEE